MKASFAIFFSFLLVWTQGEMAWGAPTNSSGARRACCSCRQVECCPPPASPSPLPLSATPVRVLVEAQAQALPAATAPLLSAPVPPIVFPSPPARWVAKPMAAPLYEQNCSYLI